ncbi:MAG: hypothetical protein E7081_02580 [Bacteroidales bacterium]|nr:hypothetical protein [Bacteroidales bacterium]
MKIFRTTLNWIEAKPHALCMMGACRISSCIGQLEFEGIAEGRKNMREDVERLAKDFRKSTEEVKNELKNKNNGKKN